MSCRRDCHIERSLGASSSADNAGARSYLFLALRAKRERCQRVLKEADTSAAVEGIGQSVASTAAMVRMRVMVVMVKVSGEAVSPA